MSIDLKAIEALTAAATPEPWEWSHDGDDSWNGMGGPGEDDSVLWAHGEHTEGWIVANKADTDFIAQSRTIVPALTAEVARLRAQVHSLTHKVHPGAVAPAKTWPDDTEINQAIADAEDFGEAIWEIAEKYDVQLTNNMERWVDGVFVRHCGDFIQEIRDAAEKHLIAKDSK